MKLLDKQQIHRQQTEQQRQQIEEGVKIARKVDELRNKLTEEQKNVTTFSTSTQKVLLQQIKELGEQKDSLLEEIADLLLEREELRKPLDSEWERVKEMRASVTEQQATLHEREVAFVQDLKEVNAQKTLLNKRASAIEKDEERVKILLEQQTTATDETVALQTQLESVLQVTKATFSQKMREFAKEEERLAVEQKNLNLKEESLKRIAKALVDKERLVNDKYATLQANISQYAYNRKRSNRKG